MSDFIIRKNGADRFTHLSNELLQNSRLSFKALGMLVYLLSLPPDWRLNMEHLAKKGMAKGKHGCGRDAVRSIVQELQHEGYLLIHKEREKGRFVRTVWFLNEEPSLSEANAPQADFPLTVNPPKEKPVVEIPSLQRINHTKNDLNKLLLPQSLIEQDRKAMLKVVSPLQHDLAQDVLDEAIGLKRAGKVRGSLVSLTHGLVKRAKEGSFRLSLGYDVRAARLSLSSQLAQPARGKISLKEHLKQAGIKLGY